MLLHSSKKLIGGMRTLGVASVAVLAVFATSIPFLSSNASAATVDNFNQCLNGTLASPAICTGANWSNGNANSSNSHWFEGDFVPYRLAISDLAAGSHTVQFMYDVTSGGKHAQDYLGSYNATASTGNDPCSGITVAGLPSGCTIGAPTSTVAVTAPDFAGSTGPAPPTGCGGSGTFSGTQVPGVIALFGPSGSTMDSFSYVNQNVVHGSGCDTTVQVDFTLSAATGSNDIVLAWGGHLASQADWGAGNSSGYITGSSFHMVLVSIDGVGIGGQDLSLNGNAVFFAPALSTTIKDSTGTAVTSVTTGTVVHDTATLTGASTTAGGTITFTLRNDTGTTACLGTTIGTPQVVTLTPGQANSPQSVSSSDFTPTTAGSYSYEVLYSGDASNVGPPSVCEPLSVHLPIPTVTTTVMLADAAVSGPVPLGSVVNDTAALTGGAPPQTGTVTYSFFANGTCTAPTTIPTQQVDVVSGAPLPSAETAPLGVGSYSFEASYSGDTANDSAMSSCEPFTVGPKATTTTTTAVFDATTNAPWAGTETAGATAYDTATISGTVSGIEPTGTVTYTFFTNGSCSGTGTTEVVTLAGGAVPHSPTTAALAAGSYSFNAVYSGDTNYVTSPVSACEPFTVAPVTSPTSPTSPTTPPATAVPPATGPIAFTGAPIASDTEIGLGLVGLGALLVVLGRLRRSRQRWLRARHAYKA
jgi:hypothetical protein